MKKKKREMYEFSQGTNRNRNRTNKLSSFKGQQDKGKERERE
jgi:hypothetical protein